MSHPLTSQEDEKRKRDKRVGKHHQLDNLQKILQFSKTFCRFSSG
ncbi:hypothetical protein SLEP1_g3005 [Rubroshorea leprosula]|uniref:Uncharacterized protein n=1 Tax=Rubroshorea leprosula TaxID=152421 RepID=A0AAV5HTB7_9ROSI|nr:hypothetical protein SLEP1_g3005 [Rubroshorea leprosula]